MVRASDLQGAARLTVDATRALADLVEAVHARVASVPGLPATRERTGGITGLVYRSVHGVTRLVGGSVDALLGLLVPLQDAAPQLPGREREAMIAALNGVFGDHLARSGNPLATPMALLHQGRPLVIERAALRRQLPAATGRVLVLVHGLCMNHLQWQRDGHDHGAMLAREAGYTPLYLHYNSGLPVAANGQALAALLKQLLALWPVPLQRLALLGHSMGGLVLRSALHQGRAGKQTWARRVDDLVCLGTPHQGAPLERAGGWIDALLGAAPYAAPFARLTRVRSAGITDLRQGRVTADGSAAPLPDGVRCWAVAASTAEQPGGLKARLVGDGLVTVASALGQHREARRRLAFAPEHQWVGHGMHHLDLLSHPAVAAQLRAWLA